MYELRIGEEGGVGGIEGIWMEREGEKRSKERIDESWKGERGNS